MLRINVTTAEAVITETELITSGRKGLRCAFTFSDDWAGLAKTVIVQGAATRDIALLATNEITVPAECVSKAQFPLKIGVYGARPDGSIAIPTIWASFGKILPGVKPSDIPPDELTPDVVAQIQEAANNALYLARNVQSMADSGALDGVSPAVTVTSITGGHNVKITDRDHPDGQDFDVPDGQDGEDGTSPTVAITEITGGHRITITDEAHPDGQSFDVMDGTGGETVEHQIGSKDSQWQQLTVGRASSGDLIGTSGYRYEQNNRRISTKPPVSINGATQISFAVQSGYKFCTYFFNADLSTMLGGNAWTAADDALTVPDGANYVVVSIAKTSNGTITTDDYDKVEIIGSYELVPFVEGLANTVENGTDGSGGGGGGITVDDALSGSSANPVQNKVVKAALDGKYARPAAGIPASDLAAAVQTSLGRADTALQQHQDISGKADKVTEVTVSTAGDVTQALDAGKIYHFTGALTALTLTLNAAAAGQQQYHLDFVSGATAPTVTIPATVTMPDGWTVEANTRYELDILDGYGVAQSWEVTA